MPPRKGCKIKEETMAETERGKKKLLIDENESSSEDFYVPPGFAKMGLAEWVERKRTPRTGTPRAPVRGICSGKNMDGSPPRGIIPTATGSGKLDEPEPVLASTDVIVTGCKKSNRETQRAQKKLRRSSRLANPKPDEPLSLTFKAVIGHGEQPHMPSTNNQAWQPTEPLKVSGWRSNPAACSTNPFNNETIPAVPFLPQSEKNDRDLTNMNQSASSDDSTAKKSEVPMPALFITEEGNHVNLPSCPGKTNENQAHSFNLTEIDLLGDCHADQDEADSHAMVTVAGCKVREEFVPTARIIERNHGDILAEYTCGGIVRSHLFEHVCAIYQKLERTTLTAITLPELEKMRNDVCDLLTAKVNVGWLAKRLGDIHQARQILQSVPAMKEQRDINKRGISELEKEVQLKEHRILEQEEEVKVLERRILEDKKMLQEAERKLELKKVEARRIRREHIAAKDPVMRFLNKSLVGEI